MDRTDELRALADVQARLQERFPDLDSEVVEAAVRLSHSKLTGHVRDFVPVLVEHAARDRLAFAARDGDSLSDSLSLSVGETVSAVDPGGAAASAESGDTDRRGPSRP